MKAAVAGTLDAHAGPTPVGPGTERTPDGRLTFMEWLRQGAALPFASKVAIVVAHQDDEVIGAGAHLARFPHLEILHVTDGAPRDLLDANREGFASREAYVSARLRELHRALSLVGHRPQIASSLGVVDQEASFNMAEISRRLRVWIEKGAFQVILTHPYEGGHPDHDATAFCVHAAVRLPSAGGSLRPELVEMTSYHNCAGSMATGEFLPSPGVEAITFALSADTQELKRRMLNCFATQEQTLRWFDIGSESFRPAPSYDFSAPPHNGKLYYELFSWGVTGDRWRELAGEALELLRS